MNPSYQQSQSIYTQPEYICYAQVNTNQASQPIQQNYQPQQQQYAPTLSYSNVNVHQSVNNYNNNQGTGVQFVNSQYLDHSQNQAYLHTPDRSTNMKSSNVKFLTPNKSPQGCKIVFGNSPSKQQIQQEVDAINWKVLSESQANQKSLGELKSNIEFLQINNSSPENRQTAKSLLIALNGPNQY